MERSNEEAAGNLNVDDLKIVLRPMAWRLFESSPAVNQFTNEEVTNAIAEANRDGLVECWVRRRFGGNLVGSGCWCRQARTQTETSLSFMHWTMLEYLAGEHLGRRVKQEGWDRARVEWGAGLSVPVSLLVGKKAWLPEVEGGVGNARREPGRGGTGGPVRRAADRGAR